MKKRRALLVAVMLITLAVAVESCPGGCSCLGRFRGETFYTKLVCVGAEWKSDNNTNRTFVMFPNNTKEVVLADLDSSDVDIFLELLLDNLGSLPHFDSLAMKRDNLTECVKCNDIASRLSSLDLSSNNFEQVGFFNSTTLESLDLSLNRIKMINQGAFRTLPSLLRLNLSSNALANVSLDGLTSLECLDLSSNRLDHVCEQLFAPLENLLHLNLSNNRLEALDDSCFGGLLRLQQLDVSWNRITRVAPGGLHLPASLARLLLEGNPMIGDSSGVGQQPALLVGTGRRLQTVDASRTGLKQVPAALTHSIRTLRLAGNSIQAVSRGDLDSYPLLQLLDFTCNRLETIEDDALGRLDSLTVLYLSTNRVKVVPRSLPERLKVLHLESNAIVTIEEGDFAGLALLEVLLLQDNEIGTIKEGAFGGLENLATLDLSGNPISTLGAGYLAGPSSLQVLRLRNLRFPASDEASFFPLPVPDRLTILDLSESPALALRLLRDEAFLASAKQLQELDLAGTGLETLRSDLMHYLSQLRALRIANNPLNCSGMQWLALWMRRQDVQEYSEIICENPPELWGTPLIDLQDEEFRQETQTVRYYRGNETKEKKESLEIKPSPTYGNEGSVSKATTTNSPLSESTTTTSENDLGFSEDVSFVSDLDNVTFYKVWNFTQTNETALFKEEPSTVIYNNTTISPAIIEANDSIVALSSSYKYYSSKSSSFQGLIRPGIAIILSAGFLLVLASLLMFTKKRGKRKSEGNLLEVGALPGVTELW